MAKRGLLLSIVLRNYLSLDLLDKLIGSSHFSENGKPVERQGRKATGLNAFT